MGELFPLTFNSMVVKLMELTTIVAEEGALIENCPSSLVVVPCDVPLMVTEALVTGLSFSSSTRPITVRFCAIRERAPSSKKLKSNTIFPGCISNNWSVKTMVKCLNVIMDKWKYICAAFGLNKKKATPEQSGLNK